MKRGIIFFLSCCILGIYTSEVTAQYCVTGVGPTSTFDSNIESVSLLGDAATSINYTGCPGVTGVEDLTSSTTVSLGVGSPYTCTVQFGTCGGNYGGAGEAWIDYNQNNTFDPSESLGTWSGTPPTAATPMAFIVPGTAISGTTRMRVMQRESGSNPLDPCGSYTWGSVVDFAVVITGGTPITCPFPSNLFTSAGTSTSALLNWTENGTATSWEVQWGAQGFSLGSGTSVVTGSNPHSLTGLATSSSFDFYVRAICGPADSSFWIGPYNFSTTFNQPVGPVCVSGGGPTYVFSDDMETAIGWTGNIGTSTGQWDFPTAFPGGNSTGTGPSGPASGTSFAEFEASGSGTTIASMVTPMIDLSGTSDDAELSFYMHAFGASMGTLTVGVGTSPTGPFTQVFTWSGQYQTAATDPWVHIGVNLASYIGQQIYIQFRYGGTGASFTADMAIDLVQVEACVSCPRPTNLAATNITAFAADFGWTENGSATNWELQWGAPGFALGSGTSVITGSNPYNATLTPGTTYDLYVRSICGPADTSSFFGPITFTTACISFIAPWIESFDATSTPNCWAESGSEAWNYSTGASFSAANAGDHTGNSGNYAWIDCGTPTGSSQISVLESPFIDISSLTIPFLSYWVYSHNGNGTGYNTMLCEVYNGSIWTTVNIINTDQDDNWKNFGFDLSGFGLVGPIKVRFTITENSPSSSAFNDILIDDIEIKDGPNVSVDQLIGVQTSYCNQTISFDMVISNNTVNTEKDVPWAVETMGFVITSGSVPVMTPNSSDTIAVSIGGVGPIGPNAMFKVYTYLAYDQILSNDTISSTVGISFTGVNAILSNPVGCTGSSNGTISASGHSGIGSYTFQWGSAAANQSTAIATGLSAGTYTVSVSDSIGCTSITSLTLVDPPALSLTDTTADLACNGDFSGWAMITPIGGVANYTYLWSNGQITSQLMNVAAGTYTVTVTDANGCSIIRSVTLNEPPAITGTIVDNGNGTATASATGGAGNFSYQWDPATGSQTTATAVGLAGGVYYVVITDADGCTDVVTVQTTIVGVDDISNISAIELFPNPSSGNVYVELDLVKQVEVQIRLTNITGQVMLSKRLGRIRSDKIELETTSLPNGVYMVQFTIGKENISKKIILAK